MKKMKGFRKVLAGLLVLMMVFSAVAALAEDVDAVVVHGTGSVALNSDGDSYEEAGETVSLIEI